MRELFRVLAPRRGLHTLLLLSLLLLDCLLALERLLLFQRKLLAARGCTPSADALSD
jgi:hypothetical protein